MMLKNDDLYNELAFYTLAHPGPNFIHQHAVDALPRRTRMSQPKPSLSFLLLPDSIFISKRASRENKCNARTCKWRTARRHGLNCLFQWIEEKFESKTFSRRSPDLIATQ